MSADKPLEEICRDLVDETLARGAPDNVTIVVFETAEAEVTVDDDPKTDELTESALQVSNATNEPVSAALLRADLGSRPHLWSGLPNLPPIPIRSPSSPGHLPRSVPQPPTRASEATPVPRLKVLPKEEDAVPSNVAPGHC